MALSLRVGNFVQFPVTLKVNDGGTDKTFKFKLEAKRLSSGQWRAHFDAWRERVKAAEAADITMAEASEDLLKTNITNWFEQTLVIDTETGQPAAFSTEGLSLVLGLFQSMTIVQAAYIDALGIKDGSTAKDARAKN